MTTAEINQNIEATLKKSGIGYEEIKVFGVVRCNVHIVCVGRDTASKWATVLAQVFKGAKVHCGEHVWNAAKNKNTVLKPTLRKGFLVAVAA